MEVGERSSGDFLMKAPLTLIVDNVKRKNMSAKVDLELGAFGSDADAEVVVEAPIVDLHLLTYMIKKLKIVRKIKEKAIKK